MSPSTAGLALAAGVLLTFALGLPGCASDPKKPRAVEPIVRDIPSVLKGTIGSETSLRGIEPLLVSGYGVVVGLNGTGGGPYPEAISATMERELARGGIGRGGPLAEGPLAGRTPRQVLSDPNVAVVIVEGVVVAGAPKETRFDVRVRSLPGSAITSLEGGTLWSTDLRIGPVTPFGSMRTRKIAEARGQLFINPYNDPSSTDGSGRRDVARVLSGGVVTDPLALEITLDNPSYPRSASIKSSINSRFPSSAGDATDTASAKSASSVQVRVPRAWVDRPEEFLRLLEATRVETAFAEEFAKRYTDELQKQPVLAEELHWCLRAIGKPAAPFVRPLYDSAESIPRWAAVRVGAAVGDPLVTPHLLSIASGASGESLSMRAEAARLMGRLPSDPRLAIALRKLASAGPLELRTAAYEALAERGDPSITRIRVGKDIRSFHVDTIPAEDPLIYIVQTERPRLVIFGEGLKLARPVIASMWSDRLLVATDPLPTDATASKDESLRSVRILFRDWRSNKTVSSRAPETLKDFVRFLAQQPSPENPEPGLGLTYSEVVGVLYQLQRQTAVQAAFATDEDRLAASISVASTKTYVEPRPESEEDRQKIEADRERMGDRTAPDGTPAVPAGKGETPEEPRFIPVPPKKKEWPSMARATDGNAPLLSCHQLSCCYGDRCALSGISLDLFPGQLMALVGPNGAGKSTLLRAMCGVLPPHAGRITLAGDDLTSLPQPTVTSRIIYLPQRSDGSIAPSLLSVGQYLALAAGPRGSIPGGEPAMGFLEAAIEDHLARIGLASRRTEPLANLSAGQQQRIALARVLLRRELLTGGARNPAWAQDRPLAILLDEPTSAMDPKHVQQTLNSLSALAAAGHAVLLATHDLLLAQQCPFSALLRADGTLAAAGLASAVLTPETLTEVFELPFDRFSGAGRLELTLPSPSADTPAIPGLSPPATPTTRTTPSAPARSR